MLILRLYVCVALDRAQGVHGVATQATQTVTVTKYAIVEAEPATTTVSETVTQYVTVTPSATRTHASSQRGRLHTTDDQTELLGELCHILREAYAEPDGSHGTSCQAAAMDMFGLTPRWWNIGG